MGKTFAVLNIAAALIAQGKRVIIYSLEMAQIDVLSRLVGVMSKQSGISVLKAFKHDIEGVTKAFELMLASNLEIHTQISDLREIEVSMWRAHKEKPVDLFIIDFMQLIGVKGAKSEYETTTAVALRIQQHAKRLKVPIIALSQISNEGAKNDTKASQKKTITVK